MTQATIGQTICRPDWTRRVRPPESVSEIEKARSMAAYGDSGSMADYEYDHYVPLELGGAVNDARNLWPEPGASPNPKDDIEDELRRKVCDGEETLGQAQRDIATNWVALARRTSTPGDRGSARASKLTPGNRGSAPSTATSAPSITTSAPAGSRAECTLSTSYNSRYHDYDVYVHSNRPNQRVTVTGGDGRSASWHTDASGYADVYLRVARDAAGGTITARVGGASCRGTL